LQFGGLRQDKGVDQKAEYYQTGKSNAYTPSHKLSFPRLPRFGFSEQGLGGFLLIIARCHSLYHVINLSRFVAIAWIAAKQSIDAACDHERGNARPRGFIPWRTSKTGHAAMQ
jgi:hypothetical protein